MRLALPASIPASCFFDQQAVPNKNSKGDIRGFPNWDWKISKQSLSTSEYCKNTTHHTKWPCLLQPFFELLAFLAVLTSSELLYVCREQICQFQLVPVSSPCLLEQNFLKGVSLIFFASRQQQIVLLKHLAASGRLGSRPFCICDACDALRGCRACDAPLASYMQRMPSCRGVTITSMIIRPKVQLLQTLRIDMRSCQTSWASRIMEAAWTMKQVHIPFWVGDRVLLGTFGTRCGERKRNVFDTVEVVNYGDASFRDVTAVWSFIQRKHNFPG